MTYRLHPLCLQLFIAFCFSAVWTSALSGRNGASSRVKTIEKVAVIGGGIGGLSLAHALTNSVQDVGTTGKPPVEVSVFDSRDKFDVRAGAGVQLNGGMAVLGKINPSVQEAVIKASVPIKRLKGRNKSWFGDSTDDLWDFSLEELIRNAGGKAEEELIVDGKVIWYSIMRGALQVRNSHRRDSVWTDCMARTIRSASCSLPDTLP
jgi:hypothetical protein